MTSEALVLADDAGIIRFWNAIAVELFGHEPNAADGEVRRFAGHLLPVKGPHGALAAIAGIYSSATEADSNLYVMG